MCHDYYCSDPDRYDDRISCPIEDHFMRTGNRIGPVVVPRRPCFLPVPEFGGREEKEEEAAALATVRTKEATALLATPVTMPSLFSCLFAIKNERQEKDSTNFLTF